MSQANLTTAEAFLLLALREDDGKPLIGSTEVTAALAGSILADLAIAGRIDIQDERVHCTDTAPLGDAELDEALSRIAADAKRRKPKWWVAKLRSEGLRKRLLARLAERGVLREETRRVLGIFPATRYPEQDPAPEQEVRERLRALIDGAQPDAPTACLFALAHTCKLDRKIFPDVDKSVLKRRAAEIAEDEWAAAAVRKVISDVQAATAATIAVAASTVAAGS